VGECFFWYQLTQVVTDKGPLNGCCCVLLSFSMMNEMFTYFTLCSNSHVAAVVAFL